MIGTSVMKDLMGYDNVATTLLQRFGIGKDF